MVHTSAWHRLFFSTTVTHTTGAKQTETSDENPNPKRWKRQKPLNTACGFLRMVVTPMTSRRSLSLTSYFRSHTPWGRVVNCTLLNNVQLFGICLVVIMTQEQWWCHQTNQKIAGVFFLQLLFSPWKSMAQSDKLNISCSRAPNIPLSMDPPGLVHLPTSWSLKNQPLAWIRQIYELESMDRVHGTLRINNPMFPCFLFCCLL